MKDYNFYIDILNELFKENDILILTGEHGSGKSNFFMQEKLEYQSGNGIFNHFIDYIYNEDSIKLERRKSSLDRKKKVIEEIVSYDNGKKILIDNLGIDLHKRESEDLIKDLLYISKENNIKSLCITNNPHIINYIDLDSVLFLCKYSDKVNLYNSLDHRYMYSSYKKKGLTNYEFYTSRYWNKR